MRQRPPGEPGSGCVPVLSAARSVFRWAFPSAWRSAAPSAFRAGSVVGSVGLSVGCSGAVGSSGRVWDPVASGAFVTVVSPAAVVEPDSAVSPSAVVPSGASVAPVSVGSSVADDSAAESCSSVCRQADSTMQPASRHRATASQTARDISLRAVYRCFLMCSSLSNSSGIPLRRGTAGDSPLSAPIIPVYPFNVNRFAHFCAICSFSLRAAVYSGERRGDTERRERRWGLLERSPQTPKNFSRLWIDRRRI